MITAQNIADITPAALAAAAPGLTAGTQVITLKGIRPVEMLRAGDKVVTRTGARVLRAVDSLGGNFRLEFDTPQVVLLAEGQIHSDTYQPFAA